MAPSELPSQFPCKNCQHHFSSRNALFRHLRESAVCAPANGLPELKREPVHAAAPIWSKKKAATAKPKGGKADAKAAAQATAKADAQADVKPLGPQPKSGTRLNLETRPEAYQDELAEKVEHVKSLFREVVDFDRVSEEVFESPPEHFRMKAEFDVCKDAAGGVDYIMFSGKERVVVQHYPMGSRVITEKLMSGVREVLSREEALKKKLFQVRFHTTLDGDAVVSLLYHTPYARGTRHDGKTGKKSAEPEDTVEDGGPLTDEWEEAATRLHTALGGVSVVGRSRGKKRVVGRDWVEERLEVAGAPAPLRYRQLESFFSQPNSAVAQHMLGWSRAVARADGARVGEEGPPRDDDLLELYCGNGNFTIALAPCFRSALGTELVKALLDAARLNAEMNGVHNAEFVRISAEDLAQAMDGVREYCRLSHLSFADYNFRTVLVDPPRAGLGPEVSEFLAARFERIVYISCSPTSLLDDLRILSQSHSVQRMALFDQFPYTEHLEMGVLLVKTSSAPQRRCRGGVAGGTLPSPAAAAAVSEAAAGAAAAAEPAGREVGLDLADSCCIA